MENAIPDSSMLLELANTTMPYGKYQGLLLLNLPEPYVVWMYGNGFPKGKLGQQLQLLYEIKLNGLEGLIKPLQNRTYLQR